MKLQTATQIKKEIQKKNKKYTCYSSSGMLVFGKDTLEHFHVQPNAVNAAIAVNTDDGMPISYDKDREFFLIFQVGGGGGFQKLKKYAGSGKFMMRIDKRMLDLGLSTPYRTQRIYKVEEVTINSKKRALKLTPLHEQPVKAGRVSKK